MAVYAIPRGEMRHSVRVELPVKTRDAVGSQKVQWEVVGTFAAKVAPISGREFAERGMQVVEGTVRVLMDYRAALKPMTTEWRLVKVEPGVGERRLNIVHVANKEEAGVMLEILCTETPGSPNA